MLVAQFSNLGAKRFSTADFLFTFKITVNFLKINYNQKSDNLQWLIDETLHFRLKMFNFTRTLTSRKI